MAATAQLTVPQIMKALNKMPDAKAGEELVRLSDAFGQAKAERDWSSIKIIGDGINAIRVKLGQAPIDIPTEPPEPERKMRS